MSGVCGVGFGHIAQERKDVLGYDFEHRRGVLVLQPGPTHLLIGEAATLTYLVLTRREYPPCDRLLKTVSLVLLASMRLVQPAHEQQVGDLLDHLERVGNATRPKGIPDPVNLGAKFPRQHATPIKSKDSS